MYLWGGVREGSWVCMNMHVFVRICVYCMYVCMCICAHMCMCVQSACVCASTCAYVYIYVFTCSCVCAHVGVIWECIWYVCVNVCGHV